MKKYDVAIVGGGAAGLACATTLARENHQAKIIVVDAGERLGKKLAVTGNGQGNITNSNMTQDYYFGSGKHLAEKLCCKNYRSAQGLFHCLFTEDEQGRVYPSGRQASALVDSFLFDLSHTQVECMLSTKVIKISNDFQLTLSNNSVIQAKYVVVCVGGKAQKQFKTDGSSYTLVQNLGHHLTKLYPSLVQIKTDTTYTKSLKGIRVDAVVTAYAQGQQLKSMRGDVIFTDYGVSGNSIFTLSPYFVDKDQVELSIEFLPEYTEQDLCDHIEKKKASGFATSEWLSGTLHNQVGRAIIKSCVKQTPQEVARKAKDFRLQVQGNLGFDYAQVTKGGVDCKEVYDNLESKLHKNLFFSGEVLDVDGACGGYNLHWAFMSGIKVAKEIAKRL